MASFEYDTVKPEKAHASRRYNLKRTCSLCLRLTLPLGLLLYCWFWSFPYFPVIKESASAYLSILVKKFYVFALVNLLVLAVWCSSTVPPAAVSNSETYETSHAAPWLVELYDQYASFSSAACQQVIVSPPAESKSTPSVDEEDDEDADDLPPVEENLVRILVLRPSLDNCYTRERSERFSGETKNERRELIRSETEPGMFAWTCGGKKRAKAMEEMNNEVFRLTVENFISSQKKLSRDENVASLTE